MPQKLKNEINVEIRGGDVQRIEYRHTAIQL